MMLLDTRLERDIATPASRAFAVLAVELDGGTLYLAGRRGALGSDILLPAVLALREVADAGVSVEIERQALPDWAPDQWWINREAAILECTPDMGSVYDGTIVFDGIVTAHPTESAGVLSVSLGPARVREVALPDTGIVEAGAWPLAADAAMGALKPLVIGSVESCPLLPVRLPAATALAVDANPGDGQLEVEDAAGLAASGTVMVDGVSYAYEAKSGEGNTLLGVTVTGSHRQGTAVVTAGDTVFLAAGHAVSAINTLRTVGAGLPATLTGGTVDLATATVTFAAPPLQLARSERFALTAQFDQVDAGSTAVNAINAIRAVTGTVTQYAGSLPAGITAATPNAGIGFGRPAGRIVKGVYTVAFSVAIGTQVGWARVRIGNEVVWMMEPPASVLYIWSPATILFDDDSDLLPVVVEVAEGGSTDQVSVTITAAERLVSLGNLDDANFAILRGPSNLLWRADQTDVLPERGPIAKARLWVRWFANGAAALPAATVKFAGRTLGMLAQTQLASASLTQTISVDVTSQGAASLPQQNISTVVGGGTASLSHSSIAQQQVVYAVTAPVGGTATERGFSKIPTLTGWESALGAIACKLTVRTTTGAAPTNIFMYANIRRANGTTIAQASVNTVSSWINVATNLYEGSLTISELPDSVFWEETFKTASTDTMISMAFSYNAKITNGSVSQNNTPASGYSNPITAQSLGHSGTAVRANNGAINFTVPAPPRVVDTLFDLSWVRSWSDLIGQAEVAYAAGGPDLCLNQVALIVDYDAQVQARAESLTATVTGLSGNPADVVSLLAGKTGQRVAPVPLRALSAWCVANGYAFGRRIAESIDALTLQAFVAEQASLLLADTGAGLAPIRLLDRAPLPVQVAAVDLLADPRFGWTERAETDIAVRYREDPSGAAGFTRVLRVDATGNADCRAGLVATGVASAVAIEAGFIRADAVASRFAADTARLHGRPRRTVALALPYSFAGTEQGDPVEYDDLLWRVMKLSRDNGFVSLDCEEVPA
jgi:hypothetical protein